MSLAPRESSRCGERATRSAGPRTWEVACKCRGAQGESGVRDLAPARAGGRRRRGGRFAETNDDLWARETRLGAPTTRAHTHAMALVKTSDGFGVKMEATLGSVAGCGVGAR